MSEKIEELLDRYFSKDVQDGIKEDVFRAAEMYAKSNPSFFTWLETNLKKSELKPEIAAERLNLLSRINPTFRAFVNDMYERFRHDHYDHKFEEEDRSGGHEHALMEALFQNSKERDFIDWTLRGIPDFDPCAFMESVGNKSVFSSYHLPYKKE